MGSRSRKSAGRAADGRPSRPARRAAGRRRPDPLIGISLAGRIAIALFTDGTGIAVDRLRMETKTGEDRGGWSFPAAADLIQQQIAVYVPPTLRNLLELYAAEDPFGRGGRPPAAARAPLKAKRSRKGT
jgi:hypothetical protein